MKLVPKLRLQSPRLPMLLGIPLVVWGLHQPLPLTPSTLNGLPALADTAFTLLLWGYLPLLGAALGERVLRWLQLSGLSDGERSGHRRADPGRGLLARSRYGSKRPASDPSAPKRARFPAGALGHRDRRRAIRVLKPESMASSPHGGDDLGIAGSAGPPCGSNGSIKWLLDHDPEGWVRRSEDFLRIRFAPGCAHPVYADEDVEIPRLTCIGIRNATGEMTW